MDMNENARKMAENSRRAAELLMWTKKKKWDARDAVEIMAIAIAGILQTANAHGLTRGSALDGADIVHEMIREVVVLSEELDPRP